MLYVVRCTVCGHEEEVNLPMTRNLEDEPYGCTRTDYHCPGIMEKRIFPPDIHKSAMPTRMKKDGVTYNECDKQ